MAAQPKLETDSHRAQRNLNVEAGRRKGRTSFAQRSAHVRYGNVDVKRSDSTQFYRQEMPLRCRTLCIVSRLAMPVIALPS